MLGRTRSSKTALSSRLRSLKYERTTGVIVRLNEACIEDAAARIAVSRAGTLTDAEIEAALQRYSATYPQWFATTEEIYEAVRELQSDRLDRYGMNDRTLRTLSNKELFDLANRRT